MISLPHRLQACTLLLFLALLHPQAHVACGGLLVLELALAIGEGLLLLRVFRRALARERSFVEEHRGRKHPVDHSRACCASYFVAEAERAGGTPRLGYLPRASPAGACANAYDWPECFSPGVSIVKPIKGTNEKLGENLEAAFRLTYPRFEIIFCFETRSEPAVALVKHLKLRFPAVDAHICFGLDEVSASGKMNNMAKGFGRARYDLIWVMDANVRTCDEDVVSVVEQLRPSRTGMVHQMPWVGPCDSTYALLERCYFSAWFPRNHCLANHGLGFCALTGMSFCIKRNAWGGIGGVAAFAGVFSEDMMMGTLLDEAGITSELAHVPVVQNAPRAYGLRAIEIYVARHVRWGRMRIYEGEDSQWSAPLEFLCEHVTLVVLMLALTTSHCTGWYATLAYIVTRFGLDTINAFVIERASRATLWSAVGGESPTRTWTQRCILFARLCMCWVLHVVLHPLIMARRYASRSVLWKGGTIRKLSTKRRSEDAAIITCHKFFLHKNGVQRGCLRMLVLLFIAFPVVALLVN